MLPNSFEELNRVRCFNHTIQLSVKALLKPFSSAGSTETNNETENGDDSMPELQAMDDKDDKEEGEDDPDVDDEDNEEEEDLLADLDDDEREELINNTEAVRTMLNKVRLNVSTISLPLHSCPFLL
jgi:hypothetical protein